jgi:hypothetical protein
MTARVFVVALSIICVVACSSSHQASLLPSADVRNTKTVAAANPNCDCLIIRSTVGNFSRRYPTVGGATTSDAWAIWGGPMQFEHFTGTAWQPVAAPTIPNESSYVDIELGNIVAIAPNDVWTSGHAIPASGPFVGFFLHWNGSTWTYVPSAPTLT